MDGLKVINGEKCMIFLDFPWIYFFVGDPRIIHQVLDLVQPQFCWIPLKPVPFYGSETGFQFSLADFMGLFHGGTTILCSGDLGIQPIPAFPKMGMPNRRWFTINGKSHLEMDDDLGVALDSGNHHL